MTNNQPRMQMHHFLINKRTSRLKYAPINKLTYIIAQRYKNKKKHNREKHHKLTLTLRQRHTIVKKNIFFYKLSHINQTPAPHTHTRKKTSNITANSSMPKTATVIKLFIIYAINYIYTRISNNAQYKT